MTCLKDGNNNYAYFALARRIALQFIKVFLLSHTRREWLKITYLRFRYRVDDRDSGMLPSFR